MTGFLRSACFISVAAVLFASQSPGAPQNSNSHTKSLTIVVQVYSSRPDPSYQLKQGSNEVNQIKTFIEQSKKIDFKGKCIPSILGYHGILVDNPQKVSGLPEHVLIYKGIIEIVGRQKEYRSDRDRVLEKFLIREALKVNVIDSDMLKQMNIDVSMNNQ